MMILYSAPASPFVRKVRVAALELGIALDVQTITAASPQVTAANPLAKIPTLVLESGEALFDSPVICDFLNALGQGDLLAASGPARWAALRLEALADGICDAAVWRRGESARATGDQHADAISKQTALMRRALDHLESAPPSSSAFGIGEIAAACALGYLDFRFAPEPWRDGRPKLAAWFAAAGRRPSMTATAPDVI